MLRKITFSTNGVLTHRQPVTGRYFRIISAAAELRARLFNQSGQVILDTRVRSGFFIQTDLFTEIVLESNDSQAVEYWASEYPLDDKAKNKGADSVKSDVALLYGGADKIAIKESRQALTICPSIDVYVGGENVTPSNGIPVAANEKYRVPVNGQVFVTTDTPAKYAVDASDANHYPLVELLGDSYAQYTTQNNELHKVGDWLVCGSGNNFSALIAIHTRTKELVMLSNDNALGIINRTPYGFTSTHYLSSDLCTTVDWALVGGRIISTGSPSQTPYKKMVQGNGFTVEFDHCDDDELIRVNGVEQTILTGYPVGAVYYDDVNKQFYMSKATTGAALIRTADFENYEVLASGSQDFARIFTSTAYGCQGMEDGTCYLSCPHAVIKVYPDGTIEEQNTPASTYAAYVYDHNIIAFSGQDKIFLRKKNNSTYEVVNSNINISGGARAIYNDNGRLWYSGDRELVQLGSTKDYSQFIGTVRLLMEQVS